MNLLSNRIVRDLRELALAHRDRLPYVGMALLIVAVYAVSKGREATTYVYKSESPHEFKEGRVLGFQGDSIYESKERLFSKSVKDILSTQAALKEQAAKLEAKLQSLESAKAAGAAPADQAGNKTAGGSQTGIGLSGTQAAQPPKEGLVGPAQPVRVAQPPEDPQAAREAAELAAARGAPPAQPIGARARRHFGGARTGGSGTAIISFPVKETPVDRSEGVVLPAGSYVKAKLMTGVEAPEGKTYPVLLQLDFAYVVPNKHKLDLSGCFMIAKSQGDLSTERVQMQASKLSCVSKEGRMFEREVSGFIADDKDNSFAVMGSINSKQDRVAAMAFLSSIVEGVGKALQQAQTTAQVTPLGGSQSVMTGNGAEYLAAGGASSAASMVTQWYLKQAQNLLPTINIGSGQDVWVIMQDTVKLPNDFFRKNLKGGPGESAYSYFSRVLD